MRRETESGERKRRKEEGRGARGEEDGWQRGTQICVVRSFLSQVTVPRPWMLSLQISLDDSRRKGAKVFFLVNAERSDSSHPPPSPAIIPQIQIESKE